MHELVIRNNDCGTAACCGRGPRNTRARTLYASAALSLNLETLYKYSAEIDVKYT